MTPGVGDRNATTVARDDAISCAGALGRRVDDVDIDVTALAQATTTTTTTPDAASRASATDADALARPFSASSPWNTADRHERRRPALADVDRARLATDRRRRSSQRCGRRHHGATCARPAPVRQHLRVDAGDRRRGRQRRRRGAHRLPAAQLRPGRQGGAIPANPPRSGPAARVRRLVQRHRRVGRRRLRHVASPPRGNLISYQFIKRWLLDGPGFSAPATRDPIGAVGARGSGLPLFAGVIHAQRTAPGADRACPCDIRARTGAAQSSSRPPRSPTA